MNTVAPVAISHLAKQYRDRSGKNLTVLDDVSFTLAAGEIVALLGPSGCGKSTLLNIIAGLQAASGGTVTVDGQTVTTRSAPNLGYVFQEDRLLPWRTALRNVTFSLEAGRMRRAERVARAQDALKLMSLEDFGRSYPHQLSGGMRARVALARSLVLNPTILLMDEPFGRLDAQTRGQMHTELLRLHSLLGMSIIFVTHDIDEAVVLADRVIVLAPRPGRIKMIVPIALDRPRDTSSAAGAGYVQDLKAMIHEA
jgi:ABC-type nitrate/sulfonate/bicarbonate transport system ATPase subunit